MRDDIGGRRNGTYCVESSGGVDGGGGAGDRLAANNAAGRDGVGISDGDSEGGDKNEEGDGVGSQESNTIADIASLLDELESASQSQSQSQSE